MSESEDSVIAIQKLERGTGWCTLPLARRANGRLEQRDIRVTTERTTRSSNTRPSLRLDSPSAGLHSYGPDNLSRSSLSLVQPVPYLIIVLSLLRHRVHTLGF
jgi:hypothetical protein